VTVICPSCSFYFAVEISGRRQQTDCPQCGAFAGTPGRDGGLVVRCVCRSCGIGHRVDVLTERAGLACPACGADAKRRDRELLEKLGGVWRQRQSPHGGAPGPPEPPGRVNLDEMEIDAGLAALVPESVALAYRCVPIRFEDGVLTVALPEPVKAGAVDDLALVLDRAVQAASTPRAALERALARVYGGGRQAPSA
jgi:hypothetical protein